MSNALAIAAVSSILKDLLTDGIIDAQFGKAVGVNVGPPPNNGVPVNGKDSIQLNLFLYQVTPNLGWRNEQLPSRNSQGDRISNPPLALDLHYLLTAYGEEEFDAEVLLGYAMQLMHQHAILSRGAIRKTFSTSSSGVRAGILPSRFQSLAAAGLAEQIELIKITPQYLDTEGMSRLWSSLQAHYRTSTAYQVSVVLIESEESSKAAPPVINRRVTALPIQSPIIEKIEPQLTPANTQITLIGQSLRGNPTQVVFTAQANTPISLPQNTAADFTNQKITVSLPSGLPAGVNTVQLLHPLDLGTPNEPHQGVSSNLAAFVLQPTLQARVADPAQYEINVLPDAAAFDNTFPNERNQLTSPITFPAIRIKVSPTVIGNQRIQLLLNEHDIAAPQTPNAYSFGPPALVITTPPNTPASTVPPPNQNSDTLVFSAPGLLPGDYLVRVRIDGADSPLTRAATTNARDPMAPFIGPILSIGGGGP